MQAAYDLGANAYVVKPVGFDEFVDAVRQIGAFWALLNEPAPVGADSVSENDAGQRAPGTPLRLLCIDDRAEDAELEQLSLSRAGYEVEATRVASEAELASALDGRRVRRGPARLHAARLGLPGRPCGSCCPRAPACR